MMLLSAIQSCQKEQGIPLLDELSRVRVHIAAMESITPILNSFGSISFRSKADVTSTVDGKIESIDADVGDRVNRGQQLVSLSNIQLEIRLDQAKSGLRSAQAALELAAAKLQEGKREVEARLLNVEKGQLQIQQKEKELHLLAQALADKKALFLVGGVSQEELDSQIMQYSAALTGLETLKKDISILLIGLRDSDIRYYGYTVPRSIKDRASILQDINTKTLSAELKVAQARVESAETELQSAEELIAELSLISPIQGIVAARYVEVGERVKTDSKVISIFESGTVDISFTVPENRGIHLQVGMEVIASVDSLNQESLIAQIRQISPTVDSQSGNFIIKAELDNSAALLRPGMFARVSVEYGQKRQAILIPETCIVNREGNSAAVFLVVDNRVFKKDISIGEEKKGEVEVLKGINESDILIDSPSALLQEGEKVEIEST